MSREVVSDKAKLEAYPGSEIGETTCLPETVSTELPDVIEAAGKTYTREEIPVSQKISFRSGSYLEIDGSQDEEVLQIIGSGGEVELKIRMTAEGPVLCFESASLDIRASGKVSIESQHISLKASHGISMETSGDMVHNVGGDHISKIDGDVSSEARIQNITARLGNVNVKANDDVRLNGERIMMNC